MRQVSLWVATKFSLDDTTVWVIDASSLIEIKKNIGLTAQQEALELLKDMVFEGQIAIPEQVIKEILRYESPDILSGWVQKIKPKLKFPTNIDHEYLKIIKRKYPNFSDINKEIDDADPYVVGPPPPGKTAFQTYLLAVRKCSSNLKLVATLQYKPEGPHVLFYMTTTSLRGIARIFRAKGQRCSRL